MMPRRKLFKADLAPDSEGGFMPKREEVAANGANVISSLAEDGLHYPVIDLDLSAYVVPSSTPGNVHLYIDKGMPWPAYAKLLLALADAGLVQHSYVDACLARGMTFVRLPWVTKGHDPSELVDGMPVVEPTPIVHELELDDPDTMVDGAFFLDR